MTDIDFRKGRWALATQTLYTQAWRTFCDWCDEHGRVALPALPSTVAEFATDRARTCKVTGVQTYLNAIRAAHKLKRAEYPVDSEDGRRYIFDAESPVFVDTMAELKRAKGTRSEPKQALTWKDLQKVVAKMPEDGFGLRDRAMILTGFGAALRRSEVVALNRNDLKFSDEGVAILIRRSKTDQAGRGVTLRIPRNKRGLCAVGALEKWIEHDDTPEGAPVFTTRTGARCTGWDYALIVKRAIRRAGVDPTRFSGHSLRRGFVTSAFERGAPIDSIKERTRHASIDMLLHYKEAAATFDSPVDKAIYG